MKKNSKQKKWGRTSIGWSRSVRFLVSDDTRTVISTILKLDQYAFNRRFLDFWHYHVILHRISFNLNQSDGTSDKSGILGLGRPFASFRNFVSSKKISFDITKIKIDNFEEFKNSFDWKLADLRDRYLFKGGKNVSPFISAR